MYGGVTCHVRGNYMETKHHEPPLVVIQISLYHITFLLSRPECAYCMPDPTTQPTILVKKADGTTARLTLDEVMKMRGKKQETRNKIKETKKPASAEAMAGRQEIEKLETGNSKLETRKKEETKKQEAKSREQGTRRELSTINNQQSPINKQPAVLAPVAKPPIA